MRTLGDWIRTLRRALARNGGKSGLDLGHATASGEVIPDTDQPNQRAAEADNPFCSSADDSPDAGTAGRPGAGCMKLDGAEQFLQEDMLESQGDRMMSVLEMFAQHPCCFTLADVSCWLELDSDRVAVTEKLMGDERFIRIGQDHSGNKRFVPLDTLVRWWIALTERLAAASQPQLDQHQLMTLITSLRRDGTWKDLPREAISVGEHFCLVRGPDESGNYHFPMAKPLSHFYPDYPDQARRILTEFCQAVRDALPMNGTPQPRESSAIANLLMTYPGCMALSELTCWLRPGADVESLVSGLETDQRTVKIREDDAKGNSFIGMDSLFQWWCALTLKLARTGRRSLGEHELVIEMNSLRAEGKWQVPPLEAVAFGKRFGFVRGPDASGAYILPVAGCLSHVSGDLIGGRKSLPSLIDAAREGYLHSSRSMETNEDWIADVLSGVLGTLTLREQKVLRLRSGIDHGRRHTLEELGREFKLTRERIRQIEKKALRRLHHPTRSRKLLPAFLRDLMARQGSLAIDAADANTPHRVFIARCLGIPFARLPELEIVLLGVSPDELLGQDFEDSFSSLADKDAIAPAVESRYGAWLTESDLAHLVGAVEVRWKPPPLGKAQKVRASMQQIALPAHYSEIAEVHNSLYPEELLSERDVHTILKTEPLDIVWIGVRGTFALKAWGYERPTRSLLESVADIVQRRYSETGKPVPYQIIAAEIGKYRQVVVPSSLAIAAACNPRVERVGKDCYLPRAASEDEEEHESTDELDEILQRFEKRGKKAKRVSSGDQGEETTAECDTSSELPPGPTTPPRRSGKAPVEGPAGGRKRGVLDESSIDELPPQVYFGLAAWARRQKKLSPWQRHFIFDIGRYRAFSRQLSDTQKRWVLKILDEATKAGFSFDRDVYPPQKRPRGGSRSGQLAFQNPSHSTDQARARGSSDDSALQN